MTVVLWWYPIFLRFQIICTAGTEERTCDKFSAIYVTVSACPEPWLTLIQVWRWRNVCACEMIFVSFWLECLTAWPDHPLLSQWRFRWRGVYDSWKSPSLWGRINSESESWSNSKWESREKGLGFCWLNYSWSQVKFPMSEEISLRFFKVLLHKLLCDFLN